MRQQYEKYTFAALVGGFILHIFVPTLLLLSNNWLKAYINVIQLTGIALFVWGCGRYSMAKGYSSWFGALGLFSLIGLIILTLFPDKHKITPHEPNKGFASEASAQSASTNQPTNSLWPIVLFEIFLLLPWAIISLMAGMSYHQISAYNRDFFLYLLWLYPIFMLMALPSAHFLRLNGRPRLAAFVAVLPPLISGASIDFL